MVIQQDLQTAVRLDKLVYRWRPGLVACLDIETLTIQRGERVFLHGPSGSGKSTLLALLGAVLSPQQGCIQMLDQDLSLLRAGQRDRFRVDHIGFIFQQFNLISYLSVLENVLLPCRFSGLRKQRALATGRTLEQEAAHLLTKLDLQVTLHRTPVAELSVGQQQRVAAARALIGAPELIIADEPTSALDAARQDGFIELLLDQVRASGSTLLFVSHDLRLARHFTRELAMHSFNRAAAEVAPELP